MTDGQETKEGRGVAVVTGGARNLGRAIVLALARDGYDVVVNTRSDVEQAEKVAAEARAHGVAAAVAAADVADPAAVGRMFAVADGLGPLRVLVNNAAARTRVPVYDVTAADWEAVRSVTLDGAMNCVLAALPRLRADGGGIVSIIGGNALSGDPGRFHVSAAKYGLVGMTKALAAACAADHVNVNAVSPSNMNPEPGQEAERESQRRREAVADTVAFLVSRAGCDVTGQLIEVGAAR
ncbi:MAG: SDR family NAD(P)-dependent oxidoreductase [Mycobacterium sp.]